MSTEQSSEPELIDQTRQQIRALVREIEGLARSEVSPEEFYEGFLHRVVAALAGVGGAVWTLDEEGRLALSSHINLGETRLHESQPDQQRHGKLLRKLLSSGEGAIVQPKYVSPEDDSGNPTDMLLVVGILKSDQQIRGLVEIFQRTGGRPAVERGYLRFLVQMCELAEDYLKTRQLRIYTDRQAIWTQLEQFTRIAHASLEPKTAAYAIANEGRRLIECDRVSVAIRKGSRCRIEAVSGQEMFDKRSNTVTLLGKLASVVVKAGEPLWYTGDTRDLAPQVEAAVEAYADEAHSKTVVVLPLAKPREDIDEREQSERHKKPEYIGALIVEQITTDGIPAAMRRRVDVVAEHGSVALTNAIEHHSLFLMPVWRFLGKSRVLVAARNLPKTIAAVVLIVAALVSLFFVPADFQIHGRGTLEPVDRRDVFAGVEGVVEKVLVKHGDDVKAGQPLVQLRNTQLEVDLADIVGRKNATAAELDSIGASMLETERTGTAEDRARARVQLSGQRHQTQTQLEGLERQEKLFREKIDQLTVRSPIDGMVVTWQTNEKLMNRPVEKGVVLLTVTDRSKDWELEVRMPEDRMGHIKRAQQTLEKDLPVTYILATDPGRTLKGTVREVHEAAEVQGEEGNSVLVRVAIDEQDLGRDVLPGATVSAKIYCGRRSLGYTWFHDVLEFIQSKILFRF